MRARAQSVNGLRKGKISERFSHLSAQIRMISNSTVAVVRSPDVAIIVIMIVLLFVLD